MNITFDYRPVISSQRRDAIARVLRLLLRTAALPYGIVVRRRNRRFDNGQSAVFRASVPVISVGNLTTGGTGKTPVVCHLAARLRRAGRRVAIVSRGYGAGDSGDNDEALELHERLPDVPHVQDADRVAAAAIATEELECDIILLDDGFQHRRLHRDHDIVVIDATCPFGFGHLLPRGLLREPVASLARADLIILTRCDAVETAEIDQIEATVAKHAEAPIVRSWHEPMHLRDAAGGLIPIGNLSDQTVAAVSAIGNPDAFEQTVARHAAKLVASRRLPDHDPFEPDTVADLIGWLSGLDVDRVICTHKDLVKLRSMTLADIPLSAIQIDLRVTHGDQHLDAIVGEYGSPD